MCTLKTNLKVILLKNEILHITEKADCGNRRKKQGKQKRWEFSIITDEKFILKTNLVSGRATFSLFKILFLCIYVCDCVCVCAWECSAHRCQRRVFDTLSWSYKQLGTAGCGCWKSSSIYFKKSKHSSSLSHHSCLYPVHSGIIHHSINHKQLPLCPTVKI